MFKPTPDRELTAAIELAKHTIRANGYKISEFNKAQILGIADRIIKACAKIPINPSR